MSLERKSARWWNLETSSFKDPDFEPLLVMPERAVQFWKKYFPHFLVDLDFNYYRDKEVYWKQVHKLLSQYSSALEIIDPCTDFPCFVKTLYNIRDVVCPKNIADGVTMITSYNENKRLSFFIYKAPIVLRDPLLYSRIINIIAESKPEFWNVFTKDLKLVQHFILFHLHTFIPSRSNSSGSLEYKFNMINIICNLLRSFPKCSEESESFVIEVLNRISYIAKDASDELAINLCRSFTNIIANFCRNKFNQVDGVRNAFNTLLENLRCDSAAFYYMFNFMKFESNNYKFLSSAKLLSVYNSRTIISPIDFDFMISMYGKVNTSCLLTMIARIALSEPIWFRTGMSFVISAYARYHPDKEIDDWSSTFFRRIIIFILLSGIFNKYVNRAAAICEFLGDIIQQSIPEHLSSLISGSIASIVQHEKVPEFVHAFLPSNFEPSIRATKEIQAFLSMDIQNSLKSFPFNSNSATFITPALRKPVNDTVAVNNKNKSTKKVRVNKRSFDETSESVRHALSEEKINELSASLTLKGNRGNIGISVRERIYSNSNSTAYNLERRNTSVNTSNKKPLSAVNVGVINKLDMNRTRILQKPKIITKVMTFASETLKIPHKGRSGSCIARDSSKNSSRATYALTAKPNGIRQSNVGLTSRRTSSKQSVNNLNKITQVQHVTNTSQCVVTPDNCPSHYVNGYVSDPPHLNNNTITQVIDCYNNLEVNASTNSDITHNSKQENNSEMKGNSALLSIKMDESTSPGVRIDDFNENFLSKDTEQDVDGHFIETSNGYSDDQSKSLKKKRNVSARRGARFLYKGGNNFATDYDVHEKCNPNANLSKESTVINELELRSINMKPISSDNQIVNAGVRQPIIPKCITSMREFDDDLIQLSAAIDSLLHKPMKTVYNKIKRGRKRSSGYPLALKRKKKSLKSSKIKNTDGAYRSAKVVKLSNIKSQVPLFPSI